MQACFCAYRIDLEGKNIVAGFRKIDLDGLTEGEVVIRLSHSTIEYKDGLAATGAGRILRKYPLNGSIDLAGTVVSSEDGRRSEHESLSRPVPLKASRYPVV